MGYRIVYDGRAGKYEVRSCNPGRFRLFLGLALLITLAFWQEGKDYIREALVPGDNQTTLLALKNLSEELRQGEGLRESVTAFCLDVIHGSVPAN